MTWRTFLTVAVMAAFAGNLPAQSYRNQDAAVGGIAGAVIGGIIGHQNDETPEGALIGGAVGAIAGGILGNAKDEQVSQRRYYQHQAWQQHHTRHAHQIVQQHQMASRAIRINDVVNMSRSGLSESVMINQIRNQGVVDHIGTHEIISMHNSGVSENVIAAMQSAPQVGTSRTTVARPATVVVEPPSQVIVHKEYVVPAPAPRVRYATRPAFPTYPSRHRFRGYW